MKSESHLFHLISYICAYVVTTMNVHETLYIPQSLGPNTEPSRSTNRPHLPRPAAQMLAAPPRTGRFARRARVIAHCPSPTPPSERSSFSQIDFSAHGATLEATSSAVSNQCVVHAFSFSPITRENKEKPRVVKCIVHNSTRSVGPCT